PSRSTARKPSNRSSLRSPFGRIAATKAVSLGTIRAITVPSSLERSARAITAPRSISRPSARRTRTRPTGAGRPVHLSDPDDRHGHEVFAESEGGEGLPALGEFEAGVRALVHLTTGLL